MLGNLRVLPALWIVVCSIAAAQEPVDVEEGATESPGTEERSTQPLAAEDAAEENDSGVSERAELRPDFRSPDRVHPAWQNFSPGFQPTICPFHGEVEYDEDIISCGYVQVPEDRTDPDSRLIGISLMRVAALTENPPAGVVIRLAGGPGQPGITKQRAAYYSGPAAEPLRKSFETIFFDQRGIGYSDPRFCRAIPRIYQYGLQMREAETRHREEMADCLDRARQAGVAVDAYSTWHNALDVRDLRKALGHQQWNIFGISYGTELAQAVLQIDAAGVRAAILDSVVPTPAADAGEYFDNPRNFRLSLDALSAACEADPECASAAGNLTERFASAIARYDTNPLVIEGFSVEQTLGNRFVLDAELAANLVFQLLYSRGFYADLPILLHVLETRNASALRAYAEFGAMPIDHFWGGGMGLITNCRGGSAISEQQKRAIAEREPEFAPWFRSGMSDCSFLYPPDPDPSVRLTESDIPTLVVSGAVDPITPPHYARAILPGLSNATYVEFAHTGHGALFTSVPESCGIGILISFLENPDGSLDTSCAQAVPAPEFVTAWRTTPSAFQFVSGLRDGDRPIAPAIIALSLAFALVAYPLGWLGRRIDARRLDMRPPRTGARLLSWLGGTLALSGLALAGWKIYRWINEHPLALPVGLPTDIENAGWIATAGVLVAAIGAILGLLGLARRKTPVATSLGTVFVFLSTVGTLVFLWSIGAGPVA